MEERLFGLGGEFEKYKGESKTEAKKIRTGPHIGNFSPAKMIIVMFLVVYFFGFLKFVLDFGRKVKIRH